MDDDITSEMEAFVDGGNIVWDDDEIIAFSKATGRDLKLFFEDGCTGNDLEWDCLLYTSPSPRDGLLSRMPSSA